MKTLDKRFFSREYSASTRSICNFQFGDSALYRYSAGHGCGTTTVCGSESSGGENARGNGGSEFERDVSPGIGDWAGCGYGKELR